MTTKGTTGAAATRLKAPTPPEWVETVMADFDTFLLDHAACERKASATGMLFVVRYPDREAMIDPLISHAREELEHFHRVFRFIADRGLHLAPDVPDRWAGALLGHARHGRDERFLDRLLVAGILEGRGCERFGILSGVLEDGPLREMYRDFTQADARHQRLFVDLAGHWFDEDTIVARLDELLDVEAELVTRLPVRAALY